MFRGIGTQPDHKPASGSDGVCAAGKRLSGTSFAMLVVDSHDLQFRDFSSAAITVSRSPADVHQAPSRSRSE
jgi:hypothetical protein